MSLTTALWPFEQGKLNLSGRLWRSLGRRITKFKAGPEYKLPAQKEREQAITRATKVAQDYFSKDDNKGLVENIDDSTSVGVSLPEYYFLHRYIMKKKPKFILELGSGRTSIIMAHALWRAQQGDSEYTGHIHSMESIDSWHEDI